MRNRQLGLLTASMLILMMSHHSYAKDIFGATLEIGNKTISNSYNNISDVGDQYNSANMKALFPNYIGTEAVSSKVNLRGVNTYLSYSANSPILSLKIPSLGIERSYGTINGNRDLSQEEFADRIKHDKELLAALSKEWVKTSPTDPVAGNPSSLLSTIATAGSDLMAGMTSDYQGTNSKDGQAAPATTSFGIAPGFGRYEVDDYKTNVYSFPINYSHWFEGQRVGLSVDVPITVTDTAGALTGSVAAGVGLNFKVASNDAYTWYLMPMLRTGVTVSEDYGTAAWVYGAGLVSNAQFPINDRATISIINMASFYKTDKLKVGDYEGQYDLENGIFRNGVEYRQILSKMVNNSPIIAKLQYARTDYSGDDLYMDVSHDLSGSLGVRNLNPNAWVNEYRVGFTATYSKGQPRVTRDDVKGLFLNMGYTF